MVSLQDFSRVGDTAVFMNDANGGGWISIYASSSMQ